MSRREFAAIGIRLVGLFLLVLLLPWTGIVGGSLWGLARTVWQMVWGPIVDPHGMALTWLTYASGFAILLALAAYLIWWNGALAERLFPSDGPEGERSAAAGDWERLVLAIVGVWLCVRAALNGIPIAWYFVASIVEGTWLSGETGATLVSVARSRLGYVLSQAALGVLLFLGMDGLTNLWRRLRPGRYVLVEESEPVGRGSG